LAKSDIKTSSFRDFLRIIFSRKSIILSTFLIVTGLVLVISLIMPPKYETATKILAKERKVDNPLLSKFYTDYRTERVAFLQSQTEIIQSDEVARRVLTKLAPAQKEATPKQVKGFQENIKVLSPKGYDITSSDIMFIQVTDSNPVRAAEEANILTDEYINYTYELKGKTAKQTVDFLEKQTQTHLEKMKQAEEQIKNFEGKSGPELAFLIATVRTKGANADLISFNNNYINAKMALRETETYLTQLRNMVQKGAVPQRMVRENPVLAAIKDNIIKLQGQLSTLRSQYTDAYPKNIMIIKEIERNKQLFNQEIKADIDGRSVDMIALEAKLKSLKEVVDQYTGLAQKQLDYSKLYRTYEVLEEGYQNLLRDIQQARIAQAMDTYKLANIEIIDRAKVPRSPISPDIIYNTLIGAIIGIFLGLGLAFVLDYFDHTLKSVEDIERHLNMSVLGSIPRH
jgi:polysaccharide biosynthesis transport protein